MEEHWRLPLDWVAIPAGEALIGVDAERRKPADGIGEPSASITLGTFLLARSPVTNADYAGFTRATGRATPAHWMSEVPPPGLHRHPVTHVDWTDALAYCQWAGVRLPTEAEWEKAARGTDARPYPWGATPPTPREVSCGGWFGGTSEVGAFPAGASPYGVLDMAGGVWEWTASLARPGAYAAGDGREDPAAPGRRVLRGGSFQHPPAEVRCAARGRLHPDARDEYIGFRVALDGGAPRPGVTVDWVAIPAGPFRMGAEDGVGAAADRDERPALGGPRHRVALGPFAITRTPITNRQYAAFVRAAATRPPGHWEGASPPAGLLDHPVTHVDWHEARAFCAWADARLPTEVEWERAAAGTDGRPYPWGAAMPDEALAWFGHPDDELGTRPVSGRRGGAGPDGVLDLAGNTWEWTSTLLRPYPYRPDDGREDPLAAGQRVLRGGSFRSPDGVYLRGAFRSRSFATRRRDHLGFRAARSLPSTAT